MRGSTFRWQDKQEPRWLDWGPVPNQKRSIASLPANPSRDASSMRRDWPRWSDKH